RTKSDIRLASADRGIFGEGSDRATDRRRRGYEFSYLGWSSAAGDKTGNAGPRSEVGYQPGSPGICKELFARARWKKPDELISSISLSGDISRHEQQFPRQMSPFQIAMRFCRICQWICFGNAHVQLAVGHHSKQGRRSRQ